VARRLDPVAIIAAKRDGKELDAAEISAWIDGYVNGGVADYQMAAWLMAGYLRGFSESEAAALTDAFVASGDQLDLSRLSGPTVDKHSTGGVADGTTMVVGPLAAALGLQMLKLSGRGLGHTGGTLDKLESIPGMRTALSSDELLDQVERIGLAVGAQTADLVPADRMIYSLRDVTATVGNVALIASSVMSKKLAGGAQTIVLDIKVGSGAFAKELGMAGELARLCVHLGTVAGRRTTAVLSDMNQPLGDEVGNASEILEAVLVLRGEAKGRLREMSLELVGQLAVGAGIAADLEAGRDQAERALESGAGLERFARFVEAQGGDPRIVDDRSLLPTAPVSRPVLAAGAGWLAAVDGEEIGLTAAGLGAGRRRKEDTIDPAVGITIPVKLGDAVAAGEQIATIHARHDSEAEEAEARLQHALTWSDEPVTAPPLVIGRVT
jgi:pyrimidine-nucleoside phosphorylase